MKPLLFITIVVLVGCKGKTQVHKTETYRKEGKIQCRDTSYIWEIVKDSIPGFAEFYDSNGIKSTKRAYKLIIEVWTMRGWRPTQFFRDSTGRIIGSDLDIGTSHIEERYYAIIRGVSHPLKMSESVTFHGTQNFK